MLTSNLPGVIARVKRFAAAIPGAAAKACAPAAWRARLEHAAYVTLRAQWASERSLARRELFEKLTPRILATFTAELLPGPVTRFTLSGPGGDGEAAAADVGGAVADHLGRQTPGGRLKKYAITTPEQEANAAAVQEALLEWVKTEKRKETEKGGRDEGLSDEQIAERLGYVLGLAGTPSDRSSAMQDPIDRMAGYIQDFINEGGGRGEGGAATVDAETVAGWLRAVLAAWLSLIRESLPLHLKDLLAIEWAKTKTNLL